MEQTIFRWYRLQMEKQDPLSGVVEVMAVPGGIVFRNSVVTTRQRQTEFGMESDDEHQAALVWVPGLTLRLDSNQRPILIGPGDDA